jgi:hypothetical protein
VLMLGGSKVNNREFQGESVQVRLAVKIREILSNFFLRVERGRNPSHPRVNPNSRTGTSPFLRDILEEKLFSKNVVSSSV